MEFHIKNISIGQLQNVVDCQNDREMLAFKARSGEYALAQPDNKTMEQAKRLRLIRERIHKIRSQYEMAKRLHVAYPRYNNWERGVQTVPTEQASKLKAITPGIDLDYIFEGEEGGLTVDALKKLRDKG